MADTTDTATGTHPDAVKINPDGTVDTGGRRGWVWCSDPLTGHRFDVRSDRLPRTGCVPVPNYPVNFKGRARNAKPYRDLAAETAVPLSDRVKASPGAPPFTADGGGGGLDIPQSAVVARPEEPPAEPPVAREVQPEFTSGDAVVAEQVTGEPTPAPVPADEPAPDAAPGDITAEDGLGGVNLAEAAAATAAEDEVPAEQAEATDEAPADTKTTTRSRKGGTR